MEPADTGDAPASGRGAFAGVFEILGGLFSILVLAGAVFLRGGSPLVLLWGLWMEEVVALAALAVRKALVHRAGFESPPIGRYFAFPAAHLVFVLVFTLAGMTGIFASSGRVLLAPPSVSSVAGVAAAFLLWALVDVVRAVLRLRRGGSMEDELAAIDRAARLTLFFPHVTIIAGGFFLVILRLGNWLAWAILAGKVLYEMFSYAISRGRR